MTIRVATSLHLDIPTFLIRSFMYHCYERNKPSILEETLIPKKAMK